MAASAVGASVLAATAIGVGAGALTMQQGRAQQKALEAQQQGVAMQREQQAQAVAAAERQESQSQQAMARANQRRPDTTQIIERAQQAGRGGPAATMLTGPQGVGQDQLQLGRSTLLGS
jgi:hypothetical protein